MPFVHFSTFNERQVHWIDVIRDHAKEIDFVNLSSKYKQALDVGDFSIMPAPFGFKQEQPEGLQAQLQISIFPKNNARYCIVKHWIFPDKLKPVIFQQLVVGEPHKISFVHPKIGLAVWQYAFENLSGYQFRCYHLTPQATTTGRSDKFAPNLNDKSDEEIDKGPRQIYIHHHQQIAMFPTTSIYTVGVYNTNL